MNAERGFELHPGAASDITSIWEFISKDNPLAAKRVREDILDAIRRLLPFPHQGHQRRDLTSRPVRFQTVRNCVQNRVFCGPKVRTSQPASQPKQLAGEQGESRAQDRARNLASREDSDDTRSV